MLHIAEQAGPHLVGQVAHLGPGMTAAEHREVGDHAVVVGDRSGDRARGFGARGCVPVELRPGQRVEQRLGPCQRRPDAVSPRAQFVGDSLSLGAHEIGPTLPSLDGGGHDADYDRGRDTGHRDPVARSPLPHGSILFDGG